MTQYHFNLGLKVLGEQGEAAVLAELQQMSKMVLNQFMHIISVKRRVQMLYNT